MIPRLPVVIGLLLIVAVLSFAGLAYQTVPVSTTSIVTQTIPLESTEKLASFSPYMVTNVVTSTSTSINGYYYTSVSVGIDWGNINNYNCVPGNAIGACYFTTVTITSYPAITQLVQSTHEVQSTATIPYSNTVTSSITESSTRSVTSLVPAYSSLGLTDAAFGTLSIVVIGVLAFMTAWIALKSKTPRSRQASISQSTSSLIPREEPKVMKAENVDSNAENVITFKNFCIECGSELPLKSKFCNNCGTKQPV